MLHFEVGGLIFVDKHYSNFFKVIGILKMIVNIPLSIFNNFNKGCSKTSREFEMCGPAPGSR